MKRILSEVNKKASSKAPGAMGKQSALAASSGVKETEVDNYPLPDRKFENVLRSRWWMNRMNDSYSFSPLFM